MNRSAYVCKFSRYISIPSLMNQIIRKHKTILSRVKLEPLKKLNLPRNHKVKLIMQQRGFEPPPPRRQKQNIKRRFISLNFLDVLSKVISHFTISLIKKRYNYCAKVLRSASNIHACITLFLLISI